MDVRVLKHTARYDAASKDLQAVHVEMVLNYRVVAERAPEVYRSIGLGYSSVIIDPGAQEILKANTATHNAAEILLKRPIIKNEVQQALANIRFDAAYEKAVEAKQIEEQKAEQKRYELIQAQRHAEIVTAEAKGKGDAALAEARGVADALRLKGEAEAAYNAKVAASLTSVLIQQQYLARWDGRLPQYSFGGERYRSSRSLAPGADRGPSASLAPSAPGSTLALDGRRPGKDNWSANQERIDGD